ncbi:MAG: molybdate ABC transporter substrate-binding protein [Cyclobacteriaceae bacterium]
MVQVKEYKLHPKPLKFFLLTFFIGLLFSFCSFSLPAIAQDEEMKIAVAANLLQPMRKVKELYERNFNSSFTLIPGSSGKLTAQILNGAPYDVFLAADMKYPQQIYAQGHGAREPEVLARGKLVFWSNKKVDAADIESYLKSKAVRSVALAQPELAPYGRRTEYWMREEGMYELLLDKIIFGESIGQVNQYIRSSTVDAAFTAISAMYAPELKEKGYWLPLEIEGGDQADLDHGMVLLTNATAESYTINQFLGFMRSPTVRQVFQDYGYELPE